MHNWNDKKLEKHYNRILKDAKENSKFTDEELEKPDLSKLNHQTKSYRILRMIKLAYYLGKLKGIREMDESKTPISFR